MARGVSKVGTLALNLTTSEVALVKKALTVYNAAVTDTKEWPSVAVQTQAEVVDTINAVTTKITEALNPTIKTPVTRTRTEATAGVKAGAVPVKTKHPEASA